MSADNFHNQAAEIGDAYNRNIAAIRADENLSDTGKRTQIEQIYENAKARMEQLRDTTKTAEATQLTSLQRKLFGTVGTAAHDTISHRDASDRATRITEEGEAVEMMNNALVANDRALQGALLKRAYDMYQIAGTPWMNVINTYEAAHPNDADALQELIDITTRDRNQRNFRRGLSSAILRPAELGGWG
ncbi:hypothetical protein [Rhodococcus zopfii]|uniref:hypothetical protein n=1 Tax=Rhodococcus zopfii TaxID=43772 RepID=UPI0011110A15|nr:hypothetical protein [Rhodococcus zopfii]